MLSEKSQLAKFGAEAGLAIQGWADVNARTKATQNNSCSMTIYETVVYAARHGKPRSVCARSR